MQQTMLSRRMFLRASVMVTGAAALAACAPNIAPAQPAAGPAVSTPTVRFASFDWFASVPGEKWDEYHQKEVFPRFQEEYGAVDLHWEPLSFDFGTKVLTNMAAGTAPDIIATWPPFPTVWAEKAQLLDLQPLVDADLPDADKLFLPSAWAQTWEPITQIRMAMITDMDVNSVYYSKTAFEEAGVPLPTPTWTTDDYANAATALTTRDGNGNVTRWGGYLRPMYDQGYFYYVEAFGGMVRDAETLLECKLGEAPAQQALAWIRQNMWESNGFAQNNQLAATGLPNAWGDGLPAGVLASVELSLNFLPFAAALPEGSWNVAHLPKGPQGQATMGAPDLYVIYKGVTERSNQDAAWQFLKWMAASEYYQDNVATKGGRLPGLLSSANKWPTIMRSLDARLAKVDLEIVLDQLSSGEARGPQTFRYHAQAMELLTPAMDQIFVEGKADVSIMQEVAQQVTEAQKATFARAGGA